MEVGVEARVVGVRQEIRLLPLGPLLLRLGFGELSASSRRKVQLHHLVRLAVDATGNPPGYGEQRLVWGLTNLRGEPRFELPGELRVTKAPKRLS